MILLSSSLSVSHFQKSLPNTISIAITVLVAALWAVLGSSWKWWAVQGSAGQSKRKSSAAHVTEVLQYFSLVDLYSKAMLESYAKSNLFGSWSKIIRYFE